MTRPLALVLLLLTPAALLGAVPADAQYMFLDFDGDGVYTNIDGFAGFNYADTVNVDLYVVTNMNFDGSTPTCSDGSLLDIYSYTVHLQAQSASVTFASVTNRMPGMVELAPLAVYPYALTASYGGTTTFPPGKHLLMSLRVVFGNGGCRNLMILPSSCFSPPGLVTSFGSNCPGDSGDYTIYTTGWGSFGCTDMPPQTPSVTCPGSIAAAIDEPISFRVLVDARGCGLWSFYGYDLPPGASLTGLGPIVYGTAEATFTWTPAPGQQGTWPVSFEASNPDPFNMRDNRSTCVTTITVQGNQPPTAEAGGPYSGFEGVALRFDGSSSSDPDGAPIVYAWDFGDGATAGEPTPFHTYAAGGSYTVVLRVTDPGGLSDADSTTATVAREVAVRVFTTASNDPTRLGRGKPLTCFQVEALDGSFTPDQVNSATVFLRYTDPLCGELEAYTTWPKSAAVGDADHNGVLDYSACFSRDAMQTLGMCMAEGARTVRLELYAHLDNGNRIRGEVQHTFLSSGPLQAAITPNPVKATSTIEFTTRKPGTVAVRLFDIRGRLMATLLEETSALSGRHRVTFESLNRTGIRLASGIYFVRVSSEHDGDETLRVTILR